MYHMAGRNLSTVALVVCCLWIINVCGHSDHQESKLHDEEFIVDTEHLKEHAEEMGTEAKDIDKMSREEQEFFFFEQHDLNNDTRLDGLEIYSAMRHAYHDSPKSSDEIDEMICTQIDTVLDVDDGDKDGYISYAEFTLLRRRTIAEGKNKHS